MTQSLRTYLDELRAARPDLYVEVERTVNPVFEAPAVVQRLYREGRSPVVMFRHVAGHDMPVVYNLCGGPDQLALALRSERGAAACEEYTRRLRHPLAPARVRSGPVGESVEKPDARRLPIVTHSELDDAPYITLGVTVCREGRDGPYNLGIYRHRLIDADHVGLYYSWGKRLQFIHAAAEERGEKLPVAIVIGMHPLMLYGSVAASAGGVGDEYEAVGGLMGEPLELVPCQSVPLEVPAQAEIVLEGHLLAGERRHEGPFGEYTGYYGQEVDAPVVELTCVTRRRDAVYPDVGMNQEHCFMNNSAREAQLLESLRKAVPSVRQLHIPVSGTCFHAYISLKKRNEGDPKNVMMVALGMDPFLKHVVVVDDDIDVYDERDVLWAIATRVRADRDGFVVTGARGNRLDPMTYNITRLNRDGMVTKIGIDATLPLGLPYELPPRMVIPGVDDIDLKAYLP